MKETNNNIEKCENTITLFISKAHYFLVKKRALSTLEEINNFADDFVKNQE
jgi:hypothetical protein